MAASLSFLRGGREQPGRAPSSPGSSPGQVRRSPPSHCLALPPRKKMRGQRNSLGFLVFPKHSGRGLLCYLLPKSGQRLRAAPGCLGSARLLPCCTQGFAPRAHAEDFLARGDGAVRKTATTKDMIVLPRVSKSLLGALVPVSQAPRMWTCRWTSGTDTWMAAHGGHQEPSARKPPLDRGNTEIGISVQTPPKPLETPSPAEIWDQTTGETWP